ncbi:hypothetical protein F442_14015, partial [Phytophthora nicotianae P10297]
ELNFGAVFKPACNHLVRLKIIHFALANANMLQLKT